MSTALDEPRRGRRRRGLVLIPVVLFVVVFVLARMGVGMFGGSSQDDNLFLGAPPLTSPDTAAAGAAVTATGGDQQILQRLADVPQATWLTPEAFPLDQVGGVVAKVAAAGERTGRTAVFVVYGITDRDCSGGYSSGGLPADQYGQWVHRIGEAAGRGTVMIVEPDALATASECGQGEQRTSLLRAAVEELASQGPTVYLDAGHASWTPPQEMADLLRAAGVDEARGFSTNVAGYESEADEQTYDEALSAALGGSHWVTDTGRNGLGSNGEWCNPDGRALGREPEAVDGGGLDAYLWIKPPGESDGTCGGGPEAGVFWTERALSLARSAGW
ncbi:MAG: Glucanase [Aeromicrobium sp.]|nr:Glucanase [Aeromicrobium sp.]